MTNHGFSDWSFQDCPFTDHSLRWRITRRGDDVLVDFAPAAGGDWKRMRVARLPWPAHAPLLAGLYACSPKGPGFRAEFTFLRIGPLPPPTTSA